MRAEERTSKWICGSSSTRHRNGTRSTTPTRDRAARSSSSAPGSSSPSSSRSRRGTRSSSRTTVHVVADPAAATWLESLNPKARSLTPLYRSGVPRRRIYEEMVEEILVPVRGSRACAVFYGHPGVFVQPSHEAVRRADGGVRGPHASRRLRRGLSRRRPRRRPGRARLAELGGDRFPPAPSVPTRRRASCSGRWTGSGSSTGTSTPTREGCSAGGGARGALSPSTSSSSTARRSTRSSMARRCGCRCRSSLCSSRRRRPRCTSRRFRPGPSTRRWRPGSGSRS